MLRIFISNALPVYLAMSCTNRSGFDLETHISHGSANVMLISSQKDIYTLVRKFLLMLLKISLNECIKTT